MTFRDLYTDNDRRVCAWVEELVKAGLVPPGDVICEDIAKIRAEDVRGYRRCHFFAGIAGWAYTVELAGWPADEPVWTASLPCQPFSVAGRGKAGEDERHLWPAFYRLVRECRPAVLIGEQVEAAVGHGWLDRVFADLEAEGYRCGAASLPACAVGAPHIRQRIFWVADRHSDGEPRPQCGVGDASGDTREHRPRQRQATEWGSDTSIEGEARGLADAAGREELASESGGLHPELGSGGRGVADTDRDGTGERPDGHALGGDVEAVRRGRDRQGSQDQGGESDDADRMAFSDGGRRQEHDAPQEAQRRTGGVSECALAHPCGQRVRAEGRGEDAGAAGSLQGEAQQRQRLRHDPWADSTFIPCADGKWRRVEPSIPLLAHGVPARVAKLRGLGNAITPQVAAEFVKAYLEARGLRRSPDHRH